MATDHQLLSARLDEMKRLKSNQYCGSKDAWEVMQKERALIEGPYNLARNVNQRLEGRFDRLSYPATPERVCGILEIVEGSVEHATKSLPNYNSPEFNSDAIPIDYLPRNFPGLRLFDANSNLYYAKIPKMGRILALVFAHANKEEIYDDERFGKETAHYLLYKYALSRANIPENLAPLMDKFMEQSLAYMITRDWSHELSCETFQKRQDESRRGVNRGVNPSYIFRRMQNDRVLHNEEYARQFLGDWLTMSGATDYQDAVKMTELRIKNRKARLEKSSKDPIRVDVIVAMNKLMLDEVEFVRELLAKKRRFVEDFLSR